MGDVKIENVVNIRIKAGVAYVVKNEISLDPVAMTKKGSDALLLDEQLLYELAQHPDQTLRGLARVILEEGEDVLEILRDRLLELGIWENEHDSHASRSGVHHHHLHLHLPRESGER